MDEKTTQPALLFRLIPGYAILPLLLALTVNGAGYFGIQKLNAYLHYYDFSLPLDGKIPFLPWFMYIYVLAYVQWIIGFITCARESREFCYRYLSAELIAKVIALSCFLLLPTTIHRPPIVGDGMTAMLSRVVYGADAPVNLFPSIHCLESWFCMRLAFQQKKTGRVYSCITSVYSILVFASVVFVKQHVLVDIIGGILVFEIGILLTRKHDFRRFYRKLELGKNG